MVVEQQIRDKSHRLHLDITWMPNISEQTWKMVSFVIREKDTKKEENADKQAD